MFSVLSVVGILFAGVALAVLCILVGGWVVFKSKTAGPGTPFIGRPPKGEVFTIPTDDEADGFPGDEKADGMLARTEEFLSKIGGKR